ncbi:MAG: hypothetical protein DRI61_13120 [Chloroflexi bacterium]|nr:MAG: hypothetical protein DRI61_13120 [Chloroflexota bacterium]
MSSEDVLKDLSSDEISQVRVIIENFALDNDTELNKVLARLPVQDLKAIKTEYINGEYFIDFANYMQLVRAYEGPIMYLAYNIVLKLEKDKLTLKDERSVMFALEQIWILQQKSKKHKKEFNAGKRFSSKDFVITRNCDVLYDRPDISPEGYNSYQEYMPDTDDERLTKKFPEVMNFLQNQNCIEARAKAIAVMNQISEHARIRVQAARRREFRKAIVRNHQYVLDRFLDLLEEKYPLHQSRYDRVVIDVYHPELLSFDHHVKRIINRRMPKLNSALRRDRIPKQGYIDALSVIAEEENDETIDKIVEQYQKDRKNYLNEGIAFDGKVISEGEYYKAILTVDPKKTGAPIRLRLIVNIQSIIQHELFEKFPEKEEHYKKHTWLQGSELNFIMPEDYPYYYSREQSVCNLVEMTARNLFFQLVEEHLNLRVIKPDDLIVYVSQWEVCWEEEFIERESDDPTFQKYNCPGLAKYLSGMVHNYHPFAKGYSNYKFEAQSSRPSFYCDIPSMNPLVPMMQYKVYPKFRNKNNNIMLRREIIPTRFFKEFGKDAYDNLPIAQKVLSNPEYCRELVERLLQLELELNGVEGLGYNERFKEPKIYDYVVWFHNLVKCTIFGKKAANYSAEYQAFLDTGKLPKTIPLHYRKKMVELELDKFLHRVLSRITDQQEEA